MRWQVIVIVSLSLLVIGLEQSPVVGQLFPGIARRCGGCGRCDDCGPQRIPRRLLRGGMVASCACPPPPCAPAPIMCPTYETRLHPRRVVGCEMVPQTVCRKQAYCETVPVTTYKRVVVCVPQTEYRTVMRYQNVAEQVMVPRRTVSTVWEPRVHKRYVPVCPPVACPPMPCVTDGCTDFGGSSVMQAPMPYNNMQPSLTVPSTPSLQSPMEQMKVPAPMQDPVFTPTDKDDSQTYYYNPGQYSSGQYSPWQTVPSRHSHPHHDMAYGDGYRTLNRAPQTASAGPRFVPAPSASTVWNATR